jgi:glycosyltransferase involved in cell wall biosynthesis
VVDGTPTDETRHIVEGLAARDPRLRYIKKLEGRASTARNVGIRAAKGDYIAFTDDDDEFLPDYLHEAVETFRDLPADVAALSCHVINRDAQGRETYNALTVDPFWKHSIGNGWIFRREVFFKDGIFFDEALVFGEDLDMHLRFHAAGLKTYVIPRPLRVYFTNTTPAEKKKAGEKLKVGGASVQGETFGQFLEKDGFYFERAGREAVAWINLFGGLIFARVGEMRKARWFLCRSLAARFTGAAFVTFVMTLPGYAFFRQYERIKVPLMRIVRSNVLNRVPKSPNT